MKRIFLNTLIFFIALLLLDSCRKQKTGGTITQSGDSSIIPKFGSGPDTIMPEPNYFKRRVIAKAKVLKKGVEFYTGKNYTGEKFVIDFGNNFRVDDYINIKSMKMYPHLRVAFDFGSECNAPESGTFRYYDSDMPDIFAACGCDENFSKIKEVFLRFTPDSLGDGVTIWEKPYLLGQRGYLPLPKDGEVKTYKLDSMGLKASCSLQIPAGYLVNVYYDKWYNMPLEQFNTSQGGLDKMYFLDNFFGFKKFESVSIYKLKSAVAAFGQ
jgi:hypothetical protein